MSISIAVWPGDICIVSLILLIYQNTFIPISDFILKLQLLWIRIILSLFYFYNKIKIINFLI